MHTIRRLLTGATAAAAALLIALAFPASGPAGAASGSATLPQVFAAKAAAQWLSGKLTTQGYIPGSTPGTAEYSETVNTLLALAAANVDLPLARTGLEYMAQNVDAYVTKDGSDGPGQLSLLILSAHALGTDPTNFGGTNLVTRLLNTEQTSGPNTGRFGTDAQDAATDAGPYDQGLALQALKAAGVAANAPAISWLQQQQCPANGGWVFNTQPDSSNPCNGDPALGLGPDTNSTAQAVEGLVAQGGMTSSMASAALSFLKNGQNSDGGWAFDPAAADNVQTSDPDSTSQVIQALLALGIAPDLAPFDVGGNTPTGRLLSFQVTSGADTGAFFSPFGSPTTGDLFASFQAVPALMGVSFPFGPVGLSYWLAGSDGGIFSFGGATFYGSMGGKALDKPVVGIAPTLNDGGYWEVASDGGIFNFGNAGFYGSMGGKTLNKPVVGLAAGPEGGGYWEVASDGGIFNFGNAAFDGSMGGKTLNKPIVGMAPTPDGRGYWEVASDGGIFSFGDAQFYGSMGGKALNKPIVGMAPTPDGGGYWEVASDGGIFSFGDAAFYGSAGALHLSAPVAGMTATTDGGGYWLVASDGGVFNYGDAAFSGSAAPFGVHNVVGATASAT
jgi:hypothetical protein